VAACHPEAAESLAQPRTPNEGFVHSGGSVAGALHRSFGRRGPQDDSVGKGRDIGADVGVFRAFVRADARLAEIHVQ
jgi:hypothetical protein